MLKHPLITKTASANMHIKLTICSCHIVWTHLSSNTQNMSNLWCSPGVIHKRIKANMATNNNWKKIENKAYFYILATLLELSTKIWWYFFPLKYWVIKPEKYFYYVGIFKNKICHWHKISPKITPGKSCVHKQAQEQVGHSHERFRNLTNPFQKWTVGSIKLLK